MSDLLIVFIGLALIFYIFFVLATSRTSIQKGFNGIPWFLFSLVLPPVAFVFVLIAKPGRAKSKEEYGFVENIIMDLTQPFVDLAHTSRALLGIKFIICILKG